MLEQTGRAAQAASRALGRTNSAERRALLYSMAEMLAEDADAIVTANAEDVEEAKNSGLSEAMRDRLLLTRTRLDAVIADVRHVAGLPDPVGQVMDGARLENGLSLIRRRVPLGVVGVIYEARPNVTVDVASLCLKTGNAAILRGGKETLRSNLALVASLRRALKAQQLPEDAVQFIDNPDRELVRALLRLDRYVDMIIPRGGDKLQQLCKEYATIPVILGGIGVCHIFVDESADVQAALPLVENAKVQRPSVCNSVETLLVHAKAAERFLPLIAGHLTPLGVTFHACETSLSVLRQAGANAVPVRDEELGREWLSLDINVRVVTGLDEALEHIRTYGSAHSEAILTKDFKNADTFVAEVDAAAVYVNASTRFTDGGQFGLGAEVAVSTQKLHARGPMGLEALTTYKWVGYGDNLTRQ